MNKKTFICEYCEKEYKTERGYKNHIEKCDKKDEPFFEEKIETKTPPQEVIDMITETIELEKPKTPTIEDKLIQFFGNHNLENIQLSKERMKLFRALYLEYHGRAMLKTCISGIVQKYKELYFITQKIKQNRKNNGK